MPADCQPAASTTHGACTTESSARRTPSARPAAQPISVTRWRTSRAPAPSAAWSRASASSRGSTEPSPGASSPARTDGSSMGSAGPALARGQLLQVHSERLLERPGLGEHGKVVAVVGDLERAVLAEASRQAGHALQFGDEVRVPAQRVLTEAEDLALGVRRLGDRRQHPRGGVGGTEPWLGIGDDDPMSLLGGAPGDAEADDARAHDHDICGLALSAHVRSLRRHDPDQVPAVGGSPAALSVRSAPDSRAIAASLSPAAAVLAGSAEPRQERRPVMPRIRGPEQPRRQGRARAREPGEPGGHADEIEALRRSGGGCPAARRSSSGRHRT